MAAITDAALLSAYVYRNSRSEAGTPPLPPGWAELEYRTIGASGFAAGVYRNAASGEIVIAYTGSNDILDYLNNIGLAAGIPTPQLAEAALVYQDVLARYGAANVSFTGHSLGGGLASVMSVLFDRPATTFALAPFEASALSPATLLEIAGVLRGNGYRDPAFERYLADPGSAFDVREDRVNNWYVSGEILAGFRRILPAITAENTPIQIGNPDISAVQRHSIDLHAALLMEENFRKAAVAVPELLGLAMNDGLYAHPNGDGSGTPNLLNVLIQGQLGDAAQGVADADLLSRFAEDVLKLAQPGAVAVQKLREALTLATIETYYEMRAGFTGPVIGQGAGYIETTLDRGAVEPTSEAQKRLLGALQEIAANHPGTRNAADFAARDHWVVQAGAGAIDVTIAGPTADVVVGGAQADRIATGSGSDFAWGGEGDDRIDGGAGNDMLLGGQGDDRLSGGEGDDALDAGLGNDTLRGGRGNDVLAGGRGNDTYVFGRGDGFDTLLEVDPRAGSFDTLQFVDGIRRADLLFSRAGNDLRIMIAGSADGVAFADWFRSSNNRVEQFVTADGVILENQVNQLVAAMAGFGTRATAATVASARDDDAGFTLGVDPNA